MSEARQRFIFLPGAAGGGDEDTAAFGAGLNPPIEFEIVGYPGWRRYVQDDFSAEALIAELTAEVERRVPTGPISLLGLSIGGHFGYAVALRLQARSREVGLFCAIDSFRVASAQPSAGWKMRAFSDALELVRKRRFAELATFVRSKAWRALLRLAGGRLAGPLRRLSAGGALPSVLAADGLAEQELSMRLLLRAVAPWVAEFDRDPKPMTAPAILLRTQLSADYDAAWCRRCPNIAIREVAGRHLTLFEPGNIGGLREAFVAAMSEVAQLDAHR